MSCMKSHQVLELMLDIGCGWAHPNSPAAKHELEFRRSGWHWGNNANGKVVLKSECGVWLYESDLDNYKARQQQGDPNAHDSVRTPEQPSWSGDGLPPIGAVVEFKDDGYWIAGEILMHRKGKAVIVDVDDNDCISSVLFQDIRPIRTDEERSVDEIVAISERAIEDGMPGEVANSQHLERAAKALLAAGYRKQGVE